MRSILEKALIALLNEEKGKADALFHDFILERSRQIHESLRQGEDFILDESWEQELSIDEMFSEADLADEELDETDEVETDVDADDTEADEDVSADDEELPEENELPIEDRVDALVQQQSELEAELQRLAAAFDAGFGNEESDLIGGDDAADDLDTEEDEEKVSEELADDFEQDEDQFESLEEGIIDTLEKVTVDHSEGKTTGGDRQKVDNQSRALSTSGDKRQAGEPVKIKSTAYSGYDREAAPKSGTMTARRNTLKQADASQSSVKKEGDASALLNKGGADKTNQTSIFDKKIK